MHPSAQTSDVQNIYITKTALTHNLSTNRVSWSTKQKSLLLKLQMVLLLYGAFILSQFTSHSYTQRATMQSAALLEFSVVAKDTSTCGQEDLGIKLPTV